MKTKLALFATALFLSACVAPPKATPMAWNRASHPTWTAHWGGERIMLEDHRATTADKFVYVTYQEFFRYCGTRHPNELGIRVVGKLPAGVVNNVVLASRKPAQPRPTPTVRSGAASIQDGDYVNPAYPVPGN